MKKKGFTLVELLAVIVILAVIAVIAVPIIIGIVKDAKYKAAVESLKGYLDAAEKTITLNELKQEANFPEADNNGCYNLKDLDKKIEAKGNRPTGIKDSDKMCFKDGNVKDMSKVIIDGYEAEVVDYEIKVDGKVVTNESSSSTGPAISYTGIPSKEYSVGESVNYLGYNWYVMKDNGNNSELVMNGYLSDSELKANLPSNVDSSNVSSSKIRMCLFGLGENISESDFLNTVGNYCYLYWNYPNDRYKEYSWNTSIVKPTVEKWIDSKMTEKSLTKENELKVMTFNDGVENITGYIRIPTLDEVKETAETENVDAGYFLNISSPIYRTDYNYLIMTKGTYQKWDVFAYSSDSKYVRNSPMKDVFNIRPVITVNES